MQQPADQLIALCMALLELAAVHTLRYVCEALSLTWGLIVKCVNVNGMPG